VDDVYDFNAPWNNGLLWRLVERVQWRNCLMGRSGGPRVDVNLPLLMRLVTIVFLNLYTKILDKIQWSMMIYENR
jgi:hypothetical protein